MHEVPLHRSSSSSSGGVSGNSAGWLSRGQSQEQPAAELSNREASLRRFLQDYEGGSYLRENPTDLRFFNAFYDLNGDGKDEAIVYLVGQCGTGGCPLMVFTPEGDSYKVVTDSPITRPPIRVLDRSFHGWRSLTFRVQGGGIQPPGYDAELRFDGRRYPWNMNEAPRVEGQVPGEVLIPGYTSEFPPSGYFGTRPQVEEGQGKALFVPGEQPACASSALPPSEVLQRALEIYLMGVHFREQESLANIGYFHAFIDLNGDGKDEAVVYLTGPDWWRSTLILMPVGYCYKVIGHIRGTEPPIRVLARYSHGWRYLAARIRRPNIPEAYEVELPFDGKIYRRSAIGPPAVPMSEDAAGEIAIPSSALGDAKPLFVEAPKK